MPKEKLVKIAKTVFLAALLTTTVSLYTIPYVIDSKLSKTKHYKEAMFLLKSNSEAIKYLGKPIIAKRVRMQNKEDYGSDENKCWLTIPVKGSISTGRLYYDFNKVEDKKTFPKLAKVELSLDEPKDYKLLIKNDLL